MHPAIRYVLYTLPPVLIAIFLCMVFIDKPIALYAAHWMLQSNLSGQKFSGGLFLLVTELSYFLILLILINYFFIKILNKNSYFLDSLGFSSLSMALAFFAKSTLQFFFGRYVPRYADSTQLLFTRNPHLYGFHWLQAGSFPSGHMSVFVAGLVGLSLYYPKLKLLSGLLSLSLGIILIILNYHFVSDIIAGAYIGISLPMAVFLLTPK